jgi:peroxiredoxin
MNKCLNLNRLNMLTIKSFLAGLCLVLLSAITAVNAAGLKPGEPAPGFSLKSLGGEQVSLKRLLTKGHVMLVFWETQCVYCYAHIKDFNALQKQYQNKGLTIAAINFLGEYESEVREYVTDNDVQYLVLADRLNNIDVAEAYKVIGSPTIVMISPDGKILSYGYKIPDVAQWVP